MTDSAQRLRERVLTDAKEGDLELTAVEQETLDRACDLATRADELSKVVKEEGHTIAGPGGIIRLHPALAEERACIALMHKMVASIQLDPAKAAETPSQAGRRAAQSRWGKHPALSAGR